MQFLDAIGLAYFWEKIKSWVGKNYLSLKGGTVHGDVDIDNGGLTVTTEEGINLKEHDTSPRNVSLRFVDGLVFSQAEGDGNDYSEKAHYDSSEAKTGKFVKNGGTATQVLMADGSVKELSQANGIPVLDAGGNIPLSQLGNLDTTVAEVVTELPTSNIKRHIYLVKDSDTTNNKYAEYVYTGDISAAYDSTKWEKLGDFRATVDLADYAKTADVNAALAKKVDVVSGKGLSTNDFTTAYKSKLDGIAANANNYSLPLAANGTRGGIQVGYAANGRNYPVQLDGEKAYVNVPWIDTTYDLTPYAKKNEVVGVNEIELVKIPQGSSTKQVITFSNINRGDATSVTFETATTSMDGFISASDKNKLDGISSGATADSAIPTSVIDALN